MSIKLLELQLKTNLMGAKTLYIKIFTVFLKHVFEHLALVISILKASNTMSSVYILSSTIFLSLILLLPVRLLFNKIAYKFMQIGHEKSISESAHQMITAFVFDLLFLCAWITEFLGIHAIFGGFLLGLSLPRKNRFNETMIKRLEDIVAIIFLPLVKLI